MYRLGELCIDKSVITYVFNLDLVLSLIQFLFEIKVIDLFPFSQPILIYKNWSYNFIDMFSHN